MSVSTGEVIYSDATRERILFCREEICCYTTSQPKRLMRARFRGRLSSNVCSSERMSISVRSSFSFGRPKVESYDGLISYGHNSRSFFVLQRAPVLRKDHQDMPEMYTTKRSPLANDWSQR